MKFVILDGFLINHDQIGMDIGGHEQVWYPSTDPSETALRIGDAQGVIVNRSPITRAVIEACPQLAYIGTLGTGFNMIDLDAASERGIVVCNTPGYATKAVAQHTIALLLDCVCHITAYDKLVKDGNWKKGNARELVSHPMRELAGMTIGIFGAGEIGYAAGEIASAIGMQVVYYRRTPPTGDGKSYVSLDTLLTQSDVISIHAPLKDDTFHFFDAECIARMKDHAILLNTARGAIVDEFAVAAALDSGKLWAYGTDVMEQEPPHADNPLLTHSKAVITPHVAWMPQEARARGLRIAAENIQAFIAGNPQNVVNP